MINMCWELGERPRERKWNTGAGLAYARVTCGPGSFLRPSRPGTAETRIRVLQSTIRVLDADFSCFMTRETRVRGFLGSMYRKRRSNASGTRLLEPRPAVVL